MQGLSDALTLLDIYVYHPYRFYYWYYETITMTIVS